MLKSPMSASLSSGFSPSQPRVSVASFATASTGAAISGLSGAAATSATLAAIGGGSLAAGGLGIAGGTAVLTGIVAFPILAVVAGAVLVSGGRIDDKQKEVEAELEQADKDFDSNEIVVRTFVGRAGRINEILTVALLASRNYLRGIERDLPADGEVRWVELEPATQGSVRRVAEIVLACLTVLALPIGMNLRRDAAVAIVSDNVDGASVPRMALELEPGDGVENEFIDFAIEQAFNQVARLDEIQAARPLGHAFAHQADLASGASCAPVPPRNVADALRHHGRHRGGR